MIKDIETQFSFNVKDVLDADTAIDDGNDDVSEYPSETLCATINQFLKGVKRLGYRDAVVITLKKESDDSVLLLDTMSCFNKKTGENYMLILFNGGSIEFCPDRDDVITFRRAGDCVTLEITQ